MKKLLVVAGIATFFFCGLFVSTVLAESKVSQFADPNYSFASLRVVRLIQSKSEKLLVIPMGNRRLRSLLSKG